MFACGPLLIGMRQIETLTEVIMANRMLRVLVSSAVFAWISGLGACGCASAQQVSSPTYTATMKSSDVLPVAKISLPDLEPFSAATIRQMVPTTRKGVVMITSAAEEGCLSECFRDKRKRNFEQMQGRVDTRVIKLSRGVFQLKDVVEALPNSQDIERINGEIVLRLPLLVGDDATLVIRDTTLRMSTAKGAFLGNTGVLFVVGAEITSWEEDAGRTTQFTDAKAFRPFVTCYSGAKAYCADSSFIDLGYGAPSSYGFTMTSHPNRHQPESSGSWPTGILVGNRFEGLYYGYYSYEAADVAIVDNHYVRSVRYGIDPHDRSTRLIIAKNISEGTLERHGIIGSRGISDSFIFENISRNNEQSGVMLDRNCTNNVICQNLVYDNGNGIAIYESSQNRLSGNVVAFNRGTGVRVRNSVDVLIHDNSIVANSGFAITCEGRELADHQKRVERGDTYQRNAGAAILSNVIDANQDGILKGRDVQYLKVGSWRQLDDLPALLQQLGGEQRTLPDTDDDPWGGEMAGFDIELQALSNSPNGLLEILRKD